MVPRDREEPPGLSHASCFHCMAQKQRRGGDNQASEQKKRKERREGEPENVGDGEKNRKRVTYMKTILTRGAYFYLLPGKYMFYI